MHTGWTSTLVISSMINHNDPKLKCYVRSLICYEGEIGCIHKAQMGRVGRVHGEFRRRKKNIVLVAQLRESRRVLYPRHVKVVNVVYHGPWDTLGEREVNW